MKTLSGLSHLFMTIFLHNFSAFMVIPAITDVTMSALAPGRDECSLAIYLTGFQQAIIGLGTLVMMPLIGNMSDKYGRKALLTVPLSLAIVPSASHALPSPMWQTMFPRVGEHRRLGFFQASHPPLSYAETFPLVSSPPPPPSRFLPQ
uniref:Major facilitator superfamily (MFS) profile domain-containing protein n=1 Tax=Salix viminalis TaxID=40686 RepID=A0A6N2LD18_SALVM